ncbi:TRAP transporter small permease subunit [Synergistaceae bacterium OttesenSCG-928-I11]|nr:TRAP transporter small permease subunit [Synergistaceae bacterium OttesenSCG-928-I11]
MKLLRRIEMFIEKTNRFLLVFLMAFIAALITLQVILRYVLHLPMHFAEEILTFCAVWVYLLGAVQASREESHINARILEIFCKQPESIKKIRAAAAGISTIVLVWLTYWSYDFFAYSLRRGKSSQILGYPMIFYECAMFICVSLMMVYAISECIRYCMKRTKVEREEVE